MPLRRPTSSYGARRGLWPVLAALLAGVLVPTGCVLWFMTTAMRNERWAVRHRLMEAYRGHLQKVSGGLNEYSSGKLAALADQGDAAGAETFARLVRAGAADGIVVYDASGKLVYPVVEVPGPEEVEVTPAWQEAAALELDDDPAQLVKAAEAYGRMADQQLLGTLYAFQTAAGNTGVLQLTGFTDDPKGVKIRYKMLRLPKGAGATPRAAADLTTFKVTPGGISVIRYRRDQRKLSTGWTGPPRGEVEFEQFALKVGFEGPASREGATGQLVQADGKAIPVARLDLGGRGDLASLTRELGQREKDGGLNWVAVILESAHIGTIERAWDALCSTYGHRAVLLVPGKLPPQHRLLAIAQAPAAAATGPAAAETARVPVGAVISRVLGPENLTQVLDVETGRILPTKRSLAWIAWRKLAPGPGVPTTPGLVTEGMILQGAPTDAQGKPTLDLWQVARAKDLPPFTVKPQAVPVYIGRPSVKFPYVAGFKTTAGTVGVLEYTRFQGQEVHLRYKILAYGKGAPTAAGSRGASTAQPGSSPAQPPVSGAFGAVTQRTIHDYKSGKDWLLDLDTGTMHSLPAALDWDRDPKAVWRWADRQGIDLTGLPVASQRGLYGYQVVARLIRQEAAAFEDVTPQTLLGAMRSGRVVTCASHDGGPDLWLFGGGQGQDVHRRAAALQGQARCLVKAGRAPEALALLTRPLSQPALRYARDGQGRLIGPNAMLLALQLMGDSGKPTFGEVADALARRLNDYAGPTMLSRQRRFLMRAFMEVSPQAATFPTLTAEDLAAEYLTGRTTPPEASRLTRTGLPGLWQIAGADGRVVALFREARLMADLASAAGLNDPPPGTALRLAPPGPADRRRPAEEAFLSVPAAEQMPGWQLELHLVGDDPFAAAAARQRTAYLWTGTLGIGVIVIFALAVARYLGRQMKLTRLKNDLIATVSHELKTPVASIRAMAETLLAGRCQGRQKELQYFGLIVKENERLSRLIDNFLTFSRMERGKRAFESEELKVDQIVAEAADSVAERFSRPGCRLEVDVPPDLPTIIGDRDALITVLLNLLSNAHKYSGPEKHVLVRAYANRNQVCLEVTDNGVGLSRRAARKVFDRFYQVDQRVSRGVGGAGLGLSIVKFVVDAHGGSVDVASRPGEGSTFTVRLPTREASDQKRNEP